MDNFERILVNALDEVLQADEIGACPRCNARIVRTIDDISVDWSCSRCRWCAGMSLNMYQELLEEVGDGR